MDFSDGDFVIYFFIKLFVKLAVNAIEGGARWSKKMFLERFQQQEVLSDEDREEENEEDEIREEDA